MESKPQLDDELVMGLVELALTQPENQRKSYLESACSGNAELFSQVWNYVQAESRMRGFLLDPLYAAAADETPFQPGELLDSRFRIVGEVARGGMGIVYEAFDEKLDRRIALKCARSGFRKRLPPEVRHASEISHPNVCKIFEIHTASTSDGEVDFLTMEFLEGETLAARLGRGRMPDAEARTIAGQICEGLAEAHRNRVVHGDLKSNNVILARDPAGGVRAVITDFGLARQPLGRAEDADLGRWVPARRAERRIIWLRSCGRASSRRPRRTFMRWASSFTSWPRDESPMARRCRRKSAFRKYRRPCTRNGIGSWRGVSIQIPRGDLQTAVKWCRRWRRRVPANGFWRPRQQRC